ncbi:MAG: DUF86 domain-containing protein [Melioribacteraceae bacterium]|nr:DUF86 domain-containing protein [Melioribacteraceae bacterium]MCF8356637.1 DUF86 domain-containing protein [Melioribacteraceae bacterium]MCF8396015.1 DUF86 domain-containing protein [Melioribacteraceae bacterium]MCF8421046.1 DUF86 domain-containing protein [Melioribacteraceae bacterium]
MHGLVFEKFVDSELLTRAFSRSIEIIGEPAKNLPEEFKKSHPNIEWKKLAGIRDKIIHHYFGVDYELIWDVINSKLPAIRIEIQKILKNMQTK